MLQALFASLPCRIPLKGARPFAADRLSVTSDVLRAKPHPDLGKLGGMGSLPYRRGADTSRLWPRRAAAGNKTRNIAWTSSCLCKEGFVSKHRPFYPACGSLVQRPCKSGSPREWFHHSSFHLRLARTKAIGSSPENSVINSLLAARPMPSSDILNIKVLI